ncbi:PucR family transcriptional regulator [Virgibacillus salexigens]|uniref:PucR family transcriptional regulator n=1 Tax=Virgibacillus salexigens TaxID=61016 RepID=UPI00190AAEC0|nr:helix-turn-helix domain-containing protein [Virgibacillus salexigens]
MSQKKDVLNSLNEKMTSLDQLADQIADIFGCPITIEDSNHHVVSYSKHKDNIDQVRISTIINRKVPDKVINGLWKKGVMPKLIDSDDPVSIPKINEVGLGNRVAISVRKHNEILGFVWAHTSDKTFTEEELVLFKEAAAYVKKFFLKDLQRHRKLEEGYRDFFWQLLRGDLQDTDAIKQREKKYNMHLEGNKAIVVIRFTDEVTEQMEKHAFYLSESQVKLHVITSLFDDNDFIMLVHLKEAFDYKQTLYAFMDQFITRISQQLDLANVFGAAGLAYQAAQQIQNSHQQAREVLKLQEKLPDTIDPVKLYEDLGVYQFIEQLAETRKADQYQNPFMEKLRAYDQQHGTSLLASLEVYLQCDSNVYNAAKRLFIHPNTMNYRLKRMGEVSGIDLKDPNQKANIYLDLIIENIQQT